MDNQEKGTKGADLVPAKRASSQCNTYLAGVGSQFTDTATTAAAARCKVYSASLCSGSAGPPAGSYGQEGSKASVAGVGKTITAESIAERSQQPLYVIGSGDLGVDINTVEEKLNRILRLATTWNAIVLLDEADVFLEQRSSRDLKRNGLVSVFLRVLEYYEGIMLLTTNRVKRFDHAFRSRIHMAIQYQKLDETSRSELWTTFIERAIEGPRPSWFNANALEELSREKLNGRQIKNVVRMAHALAIAANFELMPEHLETSLQNMRVFEQIMGVDEDYASDEIDDYDEVEEASNPRKRSRRDG